MYQMKKCFLVVALATVFVTFPVITADLSAQPFKPAVVVSVSSVDDVMGNISRLGNLAGRGDVIMLMRLTTSVYTVGVDTKKPMGLLMSFKPEADQRSDVLAFVPVTDLDTQLVAMREQLGEPRKLENGILGLNNDIYIKQQGNWAFIATGKNLLKNLPPRPESLLRGMNKKYTIGIRVNVQDVPEQRRERFSKGMQAGFRGGPRRRGQAEEGSELAERQKKLEEFQVAQTRRVIDDLKTAEIGIYFNKEKGTTELHFSMQAMEGSRFAEELSLQRKLTTKHKGFVMPDAAVTVLMSTRIREEEIEQTAKTYALMRDVYIAQVKKSTNPNIPEEAPEMMRELAEVLIETVRLGGFDIAGSALLDAKHACFVAAMGVAETRRLDNVLRRASGILEKKAKENGVDITLKHNTASYKGVKFHMMETPTVGDGLKKIFGERISLYFGVGKGAFYVAGGKDALETVKKCIDKSNSPGPALPFDLMVHLGKITECLAANEFSPGAMAAAECFAEYSGKDIISVRGTVEGETFKYSIRVDDSLFDAIGQSQQAESED